MGTLDGKVAIVTGAGTGIGKAIAQRFVAEGAQVFALARNAKNLELLACEAPQSIKIFSCDVSIPEQVAAAFDVLKKEFGRLDIVVNNAGISGPSGKLLHETTLEEWDAVNNVNLRGIYLMLHAAIPLLLESGGSVVNIASTGGLMASPGNSAYYASKGAVVQLTRAAAMDYARSGVRVNAICPGIIETPILNNAPKAMIAGMLSRVPLQRLGKPEEIAALTAFLSSKDADFITGAIYAADGGVTAGSV